MGGVGSVGGRMARKSEGGMREYKVQKDESETDVWS